MVGMLAKRQCAHVLLDSMKESKSSQAFAKALDHLANRPGEKDFPEVDPGLLPSYQELQFHGSIDIQRDVDMLVVHPSELNDDTRKWILEFKRRFNVRVIISGLIMTESV